MKINENTLIAFNSYGGFTSDKKEYVILNQNTPLPWCNILSNENFGTVISNKGTVYTYFKNSREFKLTNWCNNWVNFEAGEKFKGIFEEDYNVVYGFGYVNIFEEKDNVKKEMNIFVPMDKNIKVQYITLENKSSETKNLNIDYILDPILGVSKEIDQEYVLCKEINDKMCLKNPYNKEFSKYVIFTNVVKNINDDMIDISYDTDNYTVKVNIKLMANSKTSFAIILGAEEKSEDNIDTTIAEYLKIDSIKKKYNETKKYWQELVCKDLKTSNEYIDIMANGWLLYQTIACRLYARTGFYQAGGAIGFRDQLQDTLSLIRTRPDMTKKQIILHSSKQFEKGDVLHWWHSHNNAGIRTYFSDDYLWLPYVLTEYVKITSDTDILDINTKYLEDKEMGNMRELYDVFLNIDKEDSVYDHSKRAILYGLSRINEKNGLLDIGDGDWNDGFSNIRGQSVWLTLFMMDLLDRFSKIAKMKNDDEMVHICEKHRHMFKHSIIANAWDETHFVRAFFENGDVLGASRNAECKIDLISQAWAVIALKDYPDLKDELELSLKTADKYLVDKDNMIVSLLYPAFDKPKNNPGYIKAYVPGTRENGGQYTHAATWLAKAYFELGNKEKGIETLKFLNPISHSDTKEKADIYMVEPYVVAADVYTNSEHIGRGGWTWYTGSSSWMYKIIEDYLS